MSSSNNSQAITTAIIGLGSMGLGMAKNIINANIPLKGYDISSASCERFSKLGGEVVDNMVDAAKNTDLLILMVVNYSQVHEILFGKNAIAKKLKKNTTIMLSSTMAPSEVRTIANEVKKSNLYILDAPVSGGKVGAESGSLTIMASGESAAFRCADAVMKAISKKIYNLGVKAGIGSTYKVVHQLAAGVHLAVAAELMTLGAKAGCEAQKLYDIVSTSAGQSWMFNDRVPHILDGDYHPRSMVDIFIKDLGLVLQTGHNLKTPLPLSAAAHQMFLAASSMGCGNLDDSAVVKAYEKLANVQVKQKN
jgi:3-hydroxyisobutyrate dehydrogenase